MKNVLIVGGTSGLGYELALNFLGTDHNVVVTGRNKCQQCNENEGLNFEALNLDFIAGTYLSFMAGNILKRMERVDLFIHSAGFYQEGRIDELSEDDMNNIFSVCQKSAQVFLGQILKKQNELPGFIAITSTSQWTPRLKEPAYTGVKSALAMVAESVSLDERVGKVLVAAPGGMATAFRRNRPREDFDSSTLLDPSWVAEKIVEFYENKYDPFGSHFEFRFVKILREQPRVEIEETRYSNK